MLLEWNIGWMNFQAAMGIQESWVWISRCVDVNGLCRGNEENLRQTFRSSHSSVFWCFMCFSCLITRTCSAVFLWFHVYFMIAIAMFFPLLVTSSSLYFFRFYFVVVIWKTFSLNKRTSLVLVVVYFLVSADPDAE